MLGTLLLMSCRRPCAGRDEYGKRVAGFSRADADFHIDESGVREHLPELVVDESEPAVAELRADPFFLMGAQVEDEDPSARDDHARGFTDRARRILRMMQRLRQHRDVDRRVADRQALELAFLP